MGLGHLIIIGTSAPLPHGRKRIRLRSRYDSPIAHALHRQLRIRQFHIGNLHQLFIVQLINGSITLLQVTFDIILLNGILYRFVPIPYLNVRTIGIENSRILTKRRRSCAQEQAGSIVRETQALVRAYHPTFRQTSRRTIHYLTGLTCIFGYPQSHGVVLFFLIVGIEESQLATSLVKNRLNKHTLTFLN